MERHEVAHLRQRGDASQGARGCYEARPRRRRRGGPGRGRRGRARRRRPQTRTPERHAFKGGERRLTIDRLYQTDVRISSESPLLHEIRQESAPTVRVNPENTSKFLNSLINNIKKWKHKLSSAHINKKKSQFMSAENLFGRDAWKTVSRFWKGSCHKVQKPQAPTPQAPIRNRQSRKVANAKGLNRNTNLT